MGCLLSKLYDKSLRARAGRRSMKYRLNDEANLDTETNSLRPTPVSVPDFSSSNTASNNKKKAGDQPKKEYSWDKRRKLDPKDFMCTNTEDEVVVKKSGKINGQQFVIDNCKRCTILVFDHCASVTIDDCEDCTLFIGPTESSVFIRNCKNCTCVFLCRQLRTRDCETCKIKLLCSTRPVIESSKDMAFGCFDCDYAGLASQLKKARLPIFCNYWSSIYDFTPPPSGSQQNWHFLDEGAEKAMRDAVVELQQEKAMLLTLSGKRSVTFKTHGEKRLDEDYHYLVLFPLEFGQEDDAARSSKAFLEVVSKIELPSTSQPKLVQVNACALTRDEIDELNSSNVLEGGGNSLPSDADKVVGIEIASVESIKMPVMKAVASELSAFQCILVDELELMRSFRTKGITG